ncbi:phosphoribosyltransferase [Salinibacillus xinjiangensis]|uniref:Phosphoribosyltransferase n=1 Tax=Salinibacillus xinjiangensis TaxID=1229268 RepID=A0A6G1X260_9BACI|nr:phosphoribosyltransferase [Salinibacillus xinjiangensis]MRG85073.1 phosphoribosyltransferase [Salinibacillus xinjiangensis]
MKSIELSLNDTKEKSIELAKKVEKNFKPDVVVFIATGSYHIGKTISDYFDIPLVEVFAVRTGNSLKKYMSPLLQLIPKGIKNTLRKAELKSGMHNKDSERKVFIERDKHILINAKRILIVDDSVDTGSTAKQVATFVKETVRNAEIKFASINIFDESKEVYKVNYFLYENHIISGPWSKDSKYHKQFLKEYDSYKKAVKSNES